MSFLIRDGLADDLAACMSLDHSTTTEHVWQMTVRQQNQGWDIQFRTERLPRPVELVYPADEKRLQRALATGQGFLVAVTRDEPEMLAYLTLEHQTLHAAALITDLVVARPYQRMGIGTRLLNVARRWSEERDCRQLWLPVATKNVPAIQFCQNSGLSFCGFNDQYFPNQDIAIFFGEQRR